MARTKRHTTACHRRGVEAAVRILGAMTEPSVDRIKPTPPSLRDQGRFLRIEKANQGPIPTATQKESRPRFTEVGPLNLTQRRV